MCENNLQPVLSLKKCDTSYIKYLHIAKNDRDNFYIIH